MPHAVSTPLAPALAHVTAWSLRAWPPLLWQASTSVRASSSLHFHHLDTRITPGCEAPGSAAGQTVWAASGEEGLDAGMAGMAWDWVQIARGVVAIADPMSLVTNVRLVGDEGEVLTAVESALFLNELVRLLPWQQEVQREVQRALQSRVN